MQLIFHYFVEVDWQGKSTGLWEETWLAGLVLSLVSGAPRASLPSMGLIILISWMQLLDAL
jgi:hypothetical protein